MESIEFLSKLITPRLLGYYRSQRDKRKIMQGGWNPRNYSSYTDEELKEWDEHLIKVKSMLDKREHVK
jgi:uncharacterized protein YecE (DUF72 family)